MELPARADFAATLARLERLSREHLVFFRLEVGRLILVDFFGGDAAAYLDKDGTKTQSFAAFLAQHGAELAELGLGEFTLRQCILGRIVADGLPDGLVERLRLRHLSELARVRDGATRNLLAQASVDNGWSTGQLRDAVHAVRAGRWPDGQPDVPGLQPDPIEEEEAPKAQLGRVVTRFERVEKDLDTAVGQLVTVTRRPSRSERERMEKMVAALEANAAVIRKALA